MHKKLIVIIPGSQTKTVGWPLLGPLSERFFTHYGVQVENYDWIEPLRAALTKLPVETMVFEWSGGISPFAIRRAARDLRKSLLAHRDREIVLFGKSLGGAIAQLVAQDSNIPVKKIICVATPHSIFKRNLPPSIELVNIYSPADDYLRFANRILYWGLGRMPVSGARNIVLSGLRHSDFNHNVQTEYNGHKVMVFDVYKELLA